MLIVCIFWKQYIGFDNAYAANGGRDNTAAALTLVTPTAV